MSATRLHPPTEKLGVWYVSTAPEKSKAVCDKPGVLNYLAVENKSAAKVYVYLYDGADSTGTLIHAPIPVEAHGVGGSDVRYGLAFDEGLYVGISTSDAAFAADAGNDVWITTNVHKRA